jgi:chemosensory pili system protein ChpA (sensor histidine kinase/response regulator)
VRCRWCQRHPAPLARRGAGQTTRVKSQLLDRMVNNAGEVMITRSRLESRLLQMRASLADMTGNLERLRHQLRDMELQSESQMQSRLAQTKEAAQGFDPLEFDRFTRVQELTRMMAESVHDVATVQRSLQQTVQGVDDDLFAQARLTRELQRDLLRTRMVDFESIADRLYGVVRQAAKDYDKPVKLDIDGGSLDMDRGVLERVAPAFEHLLRNAVGHGIESAAVRAAAGKPSVGSIHIKVVQQSNDVVVTLRDDGAGLNLPAIRDKAIAQGQISAAQTLQRRRACQADFYLGSVDRC